MKSRSRDGLGAKGLEKVSSSTTTTTTTTTTTIMMNNTEQFLAPISQVGTEEVFTPIAAFRLQDL